MNEERALVEIDRAMGRWVLNRQTGAQTLRQVLTAVTRYTDPDSPVPGIADPEQHDEVTRALLVLVLTPHVQRYLQAHDPKALAQATEALTRAGVSL